MMRYPVMHRLILVLILFVLALGVDAQKRPRRQKGNDVQTPENAQEREAAKRAETEASYSEKRTSHLEIQDKATRKRMKKTFRKAEQQARGRLIPWYKRLFRKRRF